MPKAPLRLAVIDVGTLKCKFEVREFDSQGKSTVLHRDKKLTVLGRDLPKTNNRIIESSIAATIAALQEFKEVMTKLGVTDCTCITTEAIRKAVNAEEVLERIFKETALELKIMTHDDEARTFFSHLTKKFPGKKIAVADIGGGSVQLVIGHDQTIADAFLFKSGTYFMQEFSATHHPTHSELAAAKKYVQKEFVPLARKKHQVDELIYGSTNIIDVMQAVGAALQPSHYAEPHLYRVHRDELEKLYQRITVLPYEARMSMYPDEPYYMWSMDNALINLFAFMDILGVDTVIPTNENISSGLFSQLLELHERSSLCL
ncbi:MAG TPA: hypothetical protein VLF60_02295 [Candidatus Saccharimonadales bacterium]|nr:hypothetical protein [Candidatus Saccharimonadales bacterium]